MIPFALPVMSGLAWRLIGAGAIVVILGGAVGYHFWTVRGLERDVAIAQRNEAKALERLAVVAASAEKLRGAVRRQNDAITALYADGRRQEAERRVRALNVLRRGERERLVIKLDDQFGPAAMNLWFQTMFGGGR